MNHLRSPWPLLLTRSGQLESPPGAMQRRKEMELGITVYGIFLGLPHPAEQRSMCRWITEQAEPIAKSIERAQREIQLMRAYRTRLITDAVTGKLDVRHLRRGGRSRCHGAGTVG